MATRYVVTVLRVDYEPGADHADGSVKYEVADSDLAAAIRRITEQMEAWGWAVAALRGREP
jgi:hypothetical protein